MLEKGTKYYHVRVSDDVRKEFQSAVPWGFQGYIMEEMMKMFIRFSIKHGNLAATAVLLEGKGELIVREEDASS